METNPKKRGPEEKTQDYLPDSESNEDLPSPKIRKLDNGTRQSDDKLHQRPEDVNNDPAPAKIRKVDNDLSGSKESDFQLHEKPDDVTATTLPGPKTPEVTNSDLRNKIKRSRGFYEIEVSLDDEGWLHECYDHCDKNKGHTDFYPVADFNKEHLPAPYQDDDIVDLIKIKSELTVCVLVKKLSENRPEYYPGTHESYPLYDFKGDERFRRFGTGWIRGVTKYKVRNKLKCCPCNECSVSDKPKTEWGIIAIQTAAHVVFDQIEARETECIFDYDKETEQGITLLPRLSGMDMKWSYVEEDVCVLDYCTHDSDLLEKLSKMCENWVTLHKKVHKKYSNKPTSQPMNGPTNTSLPDSNSEHNLIIIISHPHGCSKTITVGKWSEIRMEHKRSKTQYFYSAPTCPGSSGAPIYILGNLWFAYHEHCHSGGTSDPALNRSGFNHDIPERITVLDRRGLIKKVAIPSPELKNVCSNPNFGLSLANCAVSQILKFCRDKHGSGVIKKRLESATQAEISLVFKKFLDQNDTLFSLMTDEHGHLVILKLLEKGTDEQRQDLSHGCQGHVFALTQHMFGRYVVQAVLESATPDVQHVVVKELSKNVMDCVKDRHGNHVIQSCFKAMDSKDLQFIVEAVAKQAFKLSTHEHGSCVLQQIFKKCTPEQSDTVLTDIRHHILRLALDQYGNKVVVSILEQGRSEHTSVVLEEIRSNSVQIAYDQHGTKVIQYLLEHCQEEDKSAMLSELLSATVQLSLDQYGTGVIQCIAKHCTEAQVAPFLEMLLPDTERLIQDRYGSCVIHQIIDKNGIAVITKIVEKIRGHLCKLSQHKFASDIMLKCVFGCSSVDQRTLFDEICDTMDENGKNPVVYSMIKNGRAHRIVQKMIGRVADDQLELLNSKIEPNRNMLRKNKNARETIILLAKS